MRGRRRLIDDREGALHIIEAIIGGLLMLSCVACLDGMSPGSARENPDDLERMSGDLLYVLEYRENRPGHPGLAQALSTPAAWVELSPAIVSDMRDRLPAGVRSCLMTPYGMAGSYPPDGAVMYVRPFLGLRMDTHEAMDCRLILWTG
ncbi:MAG: hypothetical protein A4E28_01452 [Methanocella sp. PtaU1.Bin125]|nr:MAG: hypothetical protein A4E28_01452 [Methanocella sp. PtaU1.Bin125]